MPKAERNYWLFKSEPGCYSIDDLASEPTKTTFWDGIRNYQVRNMLRDEVKKGDYVFFYHSNAKPMAIVGAMKVVKEGYPDFTALDSTNQHYDPKSSEENPRWYMVDVKYIETFKIPIDREMLKGNKVTAGMEIMKKGSRLSVTPVTAEQWNAVYDLLGKKPPK